jgi:hypothetical protein
MGLVFACTFEPLLHVRPDIGLIFGRDLRTVSNRYPENAVVPCLERIMTEVLRVLVGPLLTVACLPNSLRLLINVRTPTTHDDQTSVYSLEIHPVHYIRIFRISKRSAYNRRYYISLAARPPSSFPKGIREIAAVNNRSLRELSLRFLRV